jgi:hypothetical protein
MSDAGTSSGSTPSRRDIPERHEQPLKELHTGDIARVTTEDTELDPVTVIAVWPYYQADFDHERHADEVFVKESRHKDMTVENPEWETVRRLKPNGIRVTFATEDGGRYAVVRWAKTEDPAFLYLLVMDSDDPDERRWDRIGRDPTVERYGEPEDRDPEYRNRMPSEDIPPVEQELNADPTFPEWCSS